LFREDIKKPIPTFAKNIGVVTSETGAVIRDIIHVTRSKNPFTNIIVYPSKVQGVGAELEIVKGVEYFNSRGDIDTIIVARGGGSLEDLAPFNTETVVRGIYKSNIPVISAVGHETDFTLCDFASDLRVPTPSVAAEIAVFDYYEQVNNILQINKNNYYYITKILKSCKDELVNVSSSICDKQKLKIEESRNQVSSTIKDIENLVNTKMADSRNKFSMVTEVISKLNPLEILKKGYAVAGANGKKLSTVESVQIGDDLLVEVEDGLIESKITKVTKVKRD
jgi:exodeoxyribonuclease VII large subunit